MSILSKFYQVTNLILLEYRTDQYKITSTYTNVGLDTTNFYMYQAADGNQYCIETTPYTVNDKDVYNITNTKYPDKADSTYYYGGTDITSYNYSGVKSGVYGRTLLVNDNNVGTTICDKNGEWERVASLNHDSIRLYLLTGYVMNNISGYSIRVKGKVSKVSGTAVIDDQETTITKRISDYITLLNWYMPKELLKDKICWLKSPLYLNSCFYDRYIEIKFPSPLDCALQNIDSAGSDLRFRNIDYVYEYETTTGESIYLRGQIDKSADILVEFASVSSTGVDFEEDSNSYECNITLDVTRTMGLKPNSNANNFNVRLYEDSETNSIMYYPVYGDINDSQDLNIDTMLSIETGTIPMLDLSDLDNANEGMDDFIEMYGDDVFRWVIINELAITYVYDKIIHIDSDNKDYEESYSEYYTNTIDYTGKTSEHGLFWRSKFIPHIKQRTGMSCKSIIVLYSAHLFNRMNNVDIVRMASMRISDPYRYELSSINTNNILQYKIINKIEKQTTNITKLEKATQEKYIRSYYDITNVLIKDNETGMMYSQGKATMKLKHSGTNYMLRLYTVNDDNTRVPLDLTGPYNYKLLFPNINGNKIEIRPKKDSIGYNLGIGSLIFYISGELATAIMLVPTSERYFSLTTDVPENKTEESTIYEGSVEWYV